MATLLGTEGLIPLFRVGYLCSPPLSPSLDSEEMGKGAVTELIQHHQFPESRGPTLGEGSEPGGGGLGCLSLCRAWRVRQRRPQTDTQGSSQFREAAFA